MPFQKLYHQWLERNFKIPTFPVQGICITGAMGNKSKLVKEQVLLILKLDGEEFDVPVLAVPGLSVPVILGVEWLAKQKAQLSFEGNCIVPDSSNDKKTIEIKGYGNVREDVGAMKLYYLSDIMGTTDSDVKADYAQMCKKQWRWEMSHDAAEVERVLNEKLNH